MTAYGGSPPNMPVNPGTPGYYMPRPRVSLDVIGEAWRLFTSQAGIWIASWMIFALIVNGSSTMVNVSVRLTLGGVGSRTEPAAVIIPILIQYGIDFVFTLIGYFLLGGLMRMAIKQVRGEMISVTDMFSATDVALPVVLCLLVVNILSGLGCIGFLVGYFVVAGLTMLAVPFVVDQRLNPIEAISQSFNTLKNDWLMASLLYGALTLLASFVGIFTCGLGLLGVLPVLVLSIALTYRNYMMSGAGPGIPGTYPPTVPGGYNLPQTGVAPTQSGYMPAQEGYTPNTPNTPATGYMPNTPASGYTPTVPMTGYTPTPGYASGETPAPSYGNPAAPTVSSAPQYTPPVENANAPTLADNNYPTRTQETPEEPKP